MHKMYAMVYWLSVAGRRNIQTVAARPKKDRIFRHISIPRLRAALCVYLSPILSNSHDLRAGSPRL